MIRYIHVCKILLVFLLANSLPVAAQNYLVRKTAEKITVDGKLDEAIWQTSEHLGPFWQYFPKDSVKAIYQTEIRMAYDAKNLYVSAVCYSKGNNYITPSFRRDYRAGGNDNISFVFDTFNDRTNAMLFGINPFGVMREALLFNGATDNSFFSEYWDNKWIGEARIEEGKWVCEMAIPFTTLRFENGSKQWNFKAYRLDMQANEQSTLVRMPQNQIIMQISYSVPIVFEEPLRKSTIPYALIPYVSVGKSDDFLNPKNPNNKEFVNIGGDAKIGVTTGMNLDLTFRPDFSNVEADRQVINLSRFDINLPEQRQFFLENSDLFSGFGGYNINPFLPPQSNFGGVGNQLVSPFFSRQIGLAVDTVTNVAVPNQILYGARLSGKVTDDWRVGFLTTQTAKDTYRGIPSNSYTVAAVQRQLFGRSNLSGIFVNKQNLNPEINERLDRFNRVGGLDFNLLSNNNKWIGKVFYHHAFTQAQSKEAFAHGLALTYNVRRVTAKWQHDWVGKGFDAQVGFVPRRNFWHISPTVGVNFYPGKFVNRYSIGFGYEQFGMPAIGTTDRVAGPFLMMGFRSNARFLLAVNQNFTYLFRDFDALRSNNALPALKAGTSYTYYNASLNYTSDMRKKIWLYATPLVGQYYNGRIVSLTGVLNYRYQPYLALATSFSYNDIRLQQGKNRVYLFGPRFDWTFTKSLFLTTNVQYNTQFKNLNINARFQWRFAPVSDLFVVYLQNNDYSLGIPRNRVIQAKISYWFNR